MKIYWINIFSINDDNNNDKFIWSVKNDYCFAKCPRHMHSKTTLNRMVGELCLQTVEPCDLFTFYCISNPQFCNEWIIYYISDGVVRSRTFINISVARAHTRTHSLWLRFVLYLFFFLSVSFHFKSLGNLSLHTKNFTDKIRRVRMVKRSA